MAWFLLHSGSTLIAQQFANKCTVYDGSSPLLFLLIFEGFFLLSLGGASGAFRKLIREFCSSSGVHSEQVVMCWKIGWER